MNWRNVFYLVSIERKSDRLLRGKKTLKYHEHRVIAYWPYWVAAILGLIGGYLGKFFIDLLYQAQAMDISGSEGIILPPLNELVSSLFIALPSVVMLGCIMLTMVQQFQLSGMKAARVVNYWLPITWQEHTLASILSNLLGFPMAIVIGCSAGILVFSAFNGVMLWALLTVVMLFGAAFIASATTEILRIVQTRFTGAVYKSSGKTVIWVRFASTLGAIVVFYLVYFLIVGGPVDFLQSLSSVQSTLWFVPFVWPGMALFYLLQNLVLEGALFFGVTLLFMGGLYYLAFNLNKRFGLYELPAITIQTKGAQYVPKTGLLGKLGFSSIEAALIRKDIRSFTRRRELMTTFIVPIVFVILPIFYSTTLSVAANIVYVAMVFLLPAGMMSMLLGNMLIGEEGQVVWRIYASPISPKNLVRAKYAFLLMLSLIVLAITGTFGALFFRPPAELIAVGFFVGVFLVFALGATGLYFGFRGADFSGGHRQKMIRQEWVFISFIACALVGLAIIAPLAPYALVVLGGDFLPFTLPSMGLIELAICMTISGAIGTVISGVLYKINLGSAKELIRKAEM
jgi:hypothetical protein